MRYREILHELKMSPTALQKFGQKSGDTITGGFEAECILADVRDNESVADYSNDGRLVRNVDITDLEEFFEVDIRNSPGLKNLSRQFDTWKDETVTNYVSEHIDEKASDLADDYNSRRDEDDHGSPKDFEDEAKEALEEHARNHLDLSLRQFFWEHGHITDWREVSDQFDITWPHIADAEDGTQWDENIAADAVESLQEYLGKKVKLNNEYHGKRSPGMYHMEPDTSLVPDDGTDMGVEIISPPMSLSEMMDDLERVMNYIDVYAYTNDSTGLHINLSIQDRTVDYTKLVLFMGDKHVLEQFGREANTFAKSSLVDIQGLASRGETSRAFDLMKQGMLDMAGKAVRDRNLSKYFSVNMQNNYVEFRSIGGDYVTQWANIKNTIMRFAQALSVACDPQAERKEYAMKLYKLLSQDTNAGNFRDAVQVFALYNGGVLPKEKMREYLLQRASQRNIKPKA